jgi:hypothetical protein
MRRPGSGLVALLLLTALTAGVGSAQTPVTAGAVRPAYVDGTRLIVFKADGSEVTGNKLVGAVIVGEGPSGVRDAFRIDNIDQDTSDPDGDVWLYSFSVQDPATQQWQPLCTPDPRGTAAGFPLSGSWSQTGEHLRTDSFSITCTSGAIGKCVRFGYKPWRTTPSGASLWEMHQACVRMLRADYCGNGRGHTRDGTHIDIIDRLGIMSEHSPGLVFEAAWTAAGATCIAKTRLGVGSPWPLEAIVKECPDRLPAPRQGPQACSMESEATNEQVWFFNRS